MIYVVMCRDRPGALDLRLANIDAHRAFLAAHEHPVATLLSGPLLTALPPKSPGAWAEQASRDPRASGA